MKTTKILFVALVIGLFTATNVQAQDHKHGDSDKETAAMAKEMYVCPMHADEKSEKSGKCSQCGMEMKKMEMKKGDMKHGAMKHDDMKKGDMKKGDMKNGNMNHSKMKSDSKESMSTDMAAAYICPMKCEGDKTYDKAGKCPTCGMEMKKVEEKKEDSKHKH
ncbi:MAG: hypothetical protein COB12_06205 [Flavobacterium sp.]|nr:MAG: hypothetical protein COB12_06205 [Flavobacterium sp.]